MKKLKNNNLVRFVVALFLFGLAIGIVVYLSFKPDLSGYIVEFKNSIVVNHNNTFLFNLIVISGIFLSSITIIGTPLIAFYIFYEGLSAGYTLTAFTTIFGFKGAMFYLLFFTVIKLIFILLVLLFSTISIKYSINFIKNVISKNIEKLYKMIIEQFLRFGIILLICIVNSGLIYFLSHRLISLFIGLIV